MHNDPHGRKPEPLPAAPVVGVGGGSLGEAFSTLTGVDHSTLIGGHYSTLLGGDFSKLTGGFGATLTAGVGSTLVVNWRDRVTGLCRVAAGVIGEGGLLPGVTYRWDDGRWISQIS